MKEFNIRLPLPKQTEQRFSDKKKYIRDRFIRDEDLEMTPEELEFYAEEKQLDALNRDIMSDHSKEGSCL